MFDDLLIKKDRDKLIQSKMAFAKSLAKSASKRCPNYYEDLKLEALYRLVEGVDYLLANDLDDPEAYLTSFIKNKLADYLPTCHMILIPRTSLRRLLDSGVELVTCVTISDERLDEQIDDANYDGIDIMDLIESAGLDTLERQVLCLLLTGNSRKDVQEIAHISEPKIRRVLKSLGEKMWN